MLFNFFFCRLNIKLIFICTNNITSTIMITLNNKSIWQCLKVYFIKIIIEYYGAAEPPVRCGESHLSGLTEPPVDNYSA